MRVSKLTDMSTVFFYQQGKPEPLGFHQFNGEIECSDKNIFFVDKEFNLFVWDLASEVDQIFKKKACGNVGFITYNGDKVRCIKRNEDIEMGETTLDLTSIKLFSSNGVIDSAVTKTNTWFLGGRKVDIPQGEKPVKVVLSDEAGALLTKSNKLFFFTEELKVLEGITDVTKYSDGFAALTMSGEIYKLVVKNNDLYKERIQYSLSRPVAVFGSRDSLFVITELDTIQFCKSKGFGIPKWCQFLFSEGYRPTELYLSGDKLVINAIENDGKPRTAADKPHKVFEFDIKF